MKNRWRVAGVNFDHFHMGDLLRMVWEHPQAEIVGICDEQPARMDQAIANFQIPADRVFTDYEQCLETTSPDLVILCPATAEHAIWTERIAPFGAHVLIEKPFAASLADADRMIRALQSTGQQLAINWPLRWYPTHATTHRIITEGRIGEVCEVHYYDGNRGPLWHGADKLEREPTAQEKEASWFYRRAAGGGSLLDYLGYGTTLGTWYHGNRKPREVICLVDQPAGLEVDEHSVTVARYEVGLSKFETRWGTFTDPWTFQPQPKCGFVIRGTEGTISSYDFEPTVRIQTRDCPAGQNLPVDALVPPAANPVQYLLHCLETGQPIDGPLSPAVSRIGQQIVDTAYQSAQRGCALPLIQHGEVA
jgi:glucose-fructose oxidoreductase